MDVQEMLGGGLLSAYYKTICKAGNYTDEINVGLYGTIKMSEI